MLDALMSWMSNLIQNLGNTILNFLPASPFREFINGWTAPSYLGWLNWFFPVSQIITILTLWLGAITLFYLYSIVMRWVKMIGD